MLTRRQLVEARNGIGTNDGYVLIDIAVELEDTLGLVTDTVCTGFIAVTLDLSAPAFPARERRSPPPARLWLRRLWLRLRLFHRMTNNSAWIMGGTEASKKAGCSQDLGMGGRGESRRLGRTTGRAIRY